MHIIQTSGQWVTLSLNGRTIMRRKQDRAIDLKTYCWTNGVQFIEVID